MNATEERMSGSTRWPDRHVPGCNTTARRRIPFSFFCTHSVTKRCANTIYPKQIVPSPGYISHHNDAKMGAVSTSTLDAAEDCELRYVCEQWHTLFAGPEAQSPKPACSPGSLRSQRTIARASTIKDTAFLSRYHLSMKFEDTAVWKVHSLKNRGRASARICLLTSASVGCRRLYSWRGESVDMAKE